MFIDCCCAHGELHLVGSDIQTCGIICAPLIVRLLNISHNKWIEKSHYNTCFWPLRLQTPCNFSLLLFFFTFDNDIGIETKGDNITRYFGHMNVRFIFKIHFILMFHSNILMPKGKGVSSCTPKIQAKSSNVQNVIHNELFRFAIDYYARIV